MASRTDSRVRLETRIVIIVSNVFPPDRGGIQTMMAALANVAAAETDDVVVVAPSTLDARAFDVDAHYRTIRYQNLYRPANVVAIAVAFCKALRVARDRTAFAANWWPSGLAIVMVPRAVRGKLVIFAHGSDVAPSKGGFRKALMQYVYGCSDVVLANSRFTKDLLAGAGVTRRVSVVSPGVDVVPIAPARSLEPTVLSVGRLVKRKGFDRIVFALAALTSRFPTIRYEIVGNGPYRAQLEDLVRKHGLGDRVVFHGVLSDADVQRAYARAWCFALPVRAVDGDVEGFGIVYLEAAMARLPALGGLHSGAGDAIVDGVTGLLVDGNDVVAVTDALAKIFENREEAERMGDRAFDRAKTFTWQRSFDHAKRALET